MILHKIALASASPRRYELLHSLGLTVEVIPSGYDELDEAHLNPAELASFHARRKLETVARAGRLPGGVPAVAADTVVDLDGVSLGKPQDAGAAAGMLAQLSGRDHLVHTAFALALPASAGPIEESVTTRVRFYRLSAAEIDDYVATGEPMDKAGAYGIQGRAAALVERIDGDFYSVMGLPLGRLIRALRRSGFAVPDSKGARSE